MSAPEQRRLAAIMFTDMVGYSALSQRDDKLALELLEEHRRVLREIFPRFNGTEIKTIGDAFLVEFQSALEAAQCSIEIQRTLAKRNHDVPAGRQIELRIGIHIGDVVHREGDVYGDGVNIASRIQPVAGAGGICVSMDVERQIHNALEVKFEKLAPTELKNIEARMELFRIVLPWERPSPAGANRRSIAAVPSSKRGARPLVTGAIALLFLVVIGIGWWWTTLPRRGPTARQGGPTDVSAKSIAILPFENLSSDKENAYFADGIQDEILTRLAKIADLKVISRTSTQKYKSAPDNLREVGRQLGVANLLEGSVQKIANAVHINVQLIRVATDEHVWAESYNRQLDDVFAVEGEVASAIAEQMNARLSGKEKQEVAARPTNNSEAYDAFLHGLAFFDRPDLLGADLRSAAESFEKAVRLDPNFALAWGKLSTVHSSLFFGGDDTSAARSAAAHEALQKALHLQPDLLETRLAEAYYHYFIERDYDRARQIFGLVHQQSPNNSEAPLALALIARRQGRWEESLAHFYEAIELDPRNLKTLMWASDTYKVMRQFPTALKLIDRALDIAPGDNGALARKVGTYQALGQLDQADAVLAQMHADTRDILTVESMAIQLLLRHHYPAGVALLESSLPKLDSSQHVYHGALLWYLGRFHELAGDVDGAKANYAGCREEVETMRREQPDNADLIGNLAATDAALGNKEAALREADQAMAKLPASKDALVGPSHEENRARVLARLGDKDRAILVLQHLLAIPYAGWFGPPVTPALLRLDPDWDNLRDDPRFQKLCQDKQE